MVLSQHIQVIGSGSYLPEERVPNSSFEGKDLWKYDARGNKIDGPFRITSDEIVRKSGIYERPRARPDELPSDMGFIAASRALEMAGISADRLEGIIVATVTEPNFPMAACKIQEKLGARKARVVYDLPAGCAGFPYALFQVSAMALKSPGIYLVGANEKLTSITDYTDINSFLFSDAAGFVVCDLREPDRLLPGSYLVSNPFEGRLGWITRDPNGILRMPEGAKVLKEAVRSMAASSKHLTILAGQQRVKAHCIHQANERITSGFEGEMNDGIEVYRTIGKNGNGSATTVPVALDEAIRNGKLAKGDLVDTVAAGTGMIISGALIQIIAA